MSLQDEAAGRRSCYSGCRCDCSHDRLRDVPDHASPTRRCATLARLGLAGRRKKPPSAWPAPRRIFTVGIGTSYHAALVGAWLLRAAGTDARAVSSFDFGVYPESADLGPDDAVVVMAHSGVKTYSTQSLARAAAAGATRISVGSLTAVHEGSAASAADRRAREIGRVYRVTPGGDDRPGASGDRARRKPRCRQPRAAFRSALEQLPAQVADALSREDDVVPIAQLAATRRVYAAGAGPNEATALEAVIKVREAAQGWIDGLADRAVLARAADRGQCRRPGGGGQRAWPRRSSGCRQIARVLEAVGTRVWLIGQGVEGLASAACSLCQKSRSCCHRCWQWCQCRYWRIRWP